MANFRMPSNGEDFFSFVQRPGSGEQRLAYFPTYAHLLVSAAAVGASRDEFEEPQEFRDREPRPIPTETFNSQQLYEICLLLAIEHDGDPAVVKDEDKVARIIEGLAAAGFTALYPMLQESGEVYWLDHWEGLVLEQLEKLQAEN